MSEFTITIDTNKVKTFGDISKVLHRLADDLHAGNNDIYDENNNLIGCYNSKTINNPKLCPKCGKETHDIHGLVYWGCCPSCQRKERSDSHPKEKCSHNDCKNDALWHFREQWYVCADHVDETEKTLQDNVDTTIVRERL